MTSCIDCYHYRRKKLGVAREGKTWMPWCLKRKQRVTKGMMTTPCKDFKEKIMTIICCLGNKSIFDLRLGRSLKQYDDELYDLIFLPTSEPLADTYNSIDVNSIRTQYIMFVHEDVFFITRDWMRRARKLCMQVENLGIAGVAGVTRKSRCVGYVDHWGSRGLARRRGFGEPCFDGRIVPVQTLDAQCLIIPKEVFRKVRFNPEFPFHMMTEDYCLNLKYVQKKKVVVIPIKVWHNEGGLGRTKVHGDLAKWHVKLWREWNKKVGKHGIHVTSKAFGIRGNEVNLPKGVIYCPKCGGDADTLTTHVRRPEFMFECRLCYHRWGRLRPKKKKVKK